MMLSEENKAKVRGFWEEAVNKGKLATVDDLVASNETVHDYPDEPPSGSGPAASRAFVTALRTWWPDIQVTVDSQIAEGDFVMTRWTAHGTYQGGDATLPETAVGKQVMVTGISINRFVNGKSVESWSEVDRLGMLRQLGVIPLAKQAGA
jgi:predicted ester cyclase